MFYGYSVSLYDTTVNKLNKHGLSNTASLECLPKKSQIMQYYVATEGLPGSNNKSDRFNYKGE